MKADTRLPHRREEFQALYDRHGREVWAIAYARWLDAETAMDIAQEAFLRLWKQVEAGEDIQNPRAWLLRVARNLAEDHAKSSFRRNGTQPPEFMNGVRSGESAPLDKMEKDEEYARVRAVLTELPPADRDILTMRYALDYDATAIADALGIAVTAVHMRLSRARQRLADKLAPAGGPPKL
jgi:RNA polymerase sigma-70 factor (ECF subfamily)